MGVCQAAVSKVMNESLLWMPTQQKKQQQRTIQYILNICFMVFGTCTRASLPRTEETKKRDALEENESEIYSRRCSCNTIYLHWCRLLLPGCLTLSVLLLTLPIHSFTWKCMCTANTSHTLVLVWHMHRGTCPDTPDSRSMGERKVRGQGLDH